MHILLQTNMINSPIYLIKNLSKLIRFEVVQWDYIYMCFCYEAEYNNNNSFWWQVVGIVWEYNSNYETS